MIAARGLAKRFGHSLALRGISLDAEPGDVLGLIGPNGAGKTTTIRILATLIPPDTGSAQVAGCDVVNDVEELRRRIGFMPELFGLYDELTVEQYLDFFARVYGFCGRERRRVVDEVLELVDLTNKREDRCEGLSKGVRQRVYLARTLLHDPQVLLLDEPASGLDPQARIDLRVLLGQLKEQGKTLLVSSHILTELEQVCTRVVVIEAGRVRFAGTMSEVAETLGEREVTLRLLDEVGADKAEALLANHAKLRANELTRQGARLTFRLAAAPADVAGLHRELVGGGIDVFSFEVREPSLESLFLDVTQGEVR
ncbi:MAG: ABC transporter ATP-binding protein [Planctomycetes bacterium]|nr:ABC transporter ATP-binding protein [Planctomycetota bacterium]